MQRSSVEEDPPTSSKENPTERTEDDRLALARPFLIVYSLIFIVMVVLVVVSRNYPVLVMGGGSGLGKRKKRKKKASFGTEGKEKSIQTQEASVLGRE